MRILKKMLVPVMWIAIGLIGGLYLKEKIRPYAVKFGIPFPA